jgi:hypothetical protein
MKIKALVGLLTLTAATSVQAIDPVVSAVVPHPVSIAVYAGKWLLEGRNKTYNITVEAEAPDLEQAKLEAFRLAVDRAVGSLLSAETEVKNQEIARHEVVSYSSGFVQRYEIKKQTPTDSGVKIEVEVWVSGTSIQNRLLATSQAAGQIEGNQASVAIESYEHNRDTGDKTLDMVLADFPKRAFKITPLPTQIRVDSDRKFTVYVPMEITWDYAYVLSLGQTLQAVKDNYQTNNIAQVKVMAKDPKAFLVGWQQVAGFNDTQKYQLFYDRYIATKPVVQVKVLTKTGDVVVQDCYGWLDLQGEYRGPDAQFFDSNYNGQRYLMTVYGNHKLSGNVSVPITAESVRDLDHVDMAVVPLKECHK